jgi:hypothetical protein
LQFSCNITPPLRSGIIDIHTKAGAALDGGAISFYGGSHETINPSFEAEGSQGHFNYFVLGSYDQNDLGIENPTGGYHAIHDDTRQTGPKYSNH